MLLVCVEIKVRARDITLPPSETASCDVLLKSAIINERIPRIPWRRAYVRPDGLSPNGSCFLEFFLRNQQIGERESPFPVRAGIFCDQTMPDLERRRGILRIGQKGKRLRVGLRRVGQNLVEQ